MNLLAKWYLLQKQKLGDFFRTIGHKIESPNSTLEVEMPADAWKRTISHARRMLNNGII